MTTSEAQKRIASDPDFVNLKRYGYSLATVMSQFPDGCPDKVIAAALLITEDDVRTMKDEVALRLRELMKVDVDDG
jgi:hypothetical protein